METTNQKGKPGIKPSAPIKKIDEIKPIEAKPDPQDSWILCSNGKINKRFPPTSVAMKDFTKITKFTPVEINKL